MSKDKARVIAEKLQKDIGDGKYGAESPLPSVRALMKRHGIARSTANRVLQHLVQTGFAECRIGSGMYPVIKKPITFAVILPDTEKPFHAAICNGLANCAKNAGESTIVFDFSTAGKIDSKEDGGVGGKKKGKKTTPCRFCLK